MIKPVKINPTEDGIKLSRWLARHYQGASMIAVRKLCRSGEIRVNSARSKENSILKTGDLVRVPPQLALNVQNVAKPSEPRFSLQDLEALRKSIIHNDDDIVIFNKPAGLAVQGGTGIKKSLDRMAQELFPNDNMLLVHRLDLETSGIIVVAKNIRAAQVLAKDFQSKDIHKEYIALLAGNIKPKDGIIEEPIDGKKAVTRYHVLSEMKNAMAFVRFAPETGRKHQLRKHSAFALNAPIVGDDLYGSREIFGKLKTLVSQRHLYLFASRISLRHPSTGKNLTINATMPEWFKLVADMCEVKI